MGVTRVEKEKFSLGYGQLLMHQFSVSKQKSKYNKYVHHKCVNPLEMIKILGSLRFRSSASDSNPQPSFPIDLDQILQVFSHGIV